MIESYIPTSSFSWVDFADEDRQKMLNVIQLFREQDTRDELGVGSVRDAFADYFLPGTSTIQTRAKYMLFVPWIYLELERQRVRSPEIAAKARNKEIQLIYVLLKSSDTAGVIGKDAKGKLQRLPSSIYWTGLASWGIRLFGGSQDQYHRHLDGYYRTLKRNEVYSSELELSGRHIPPNWHRGIPQPPARMMEEASLQLTKEEAQYLQEQIIFHHPKSLLAKLVSLDQHHSVDFLWDHPAVHLLTEGLRRDLLHARNFSEAIHGAALLYNLMLAEAIKSDDLIAKYEEQLRSWRKKIEKRWNDFVGWHANISAFWHLDAFKQARIAKATMTFVNEWLNCVFRATDVGKIPENAYVQALIRNREYQLKGNRARLGNPAALKQWSGASGHIQLNYRWGNVSVIVADILDGMGRVRNNAQPE